MPGESHDDPPLPPERSLSEDQAREAQALTAALWKSHASDHEERSRSLRESVEQSRKRKAQRDRLRGREPTASSRDPTEAAQRDPRFENVAFVRSIAQAFLNGRFRACQTAAIAGILAERQPGGPRPSSASIAREIGYTRAHVNAAQYGRKLLSGPAWSFLVNIYAETLQRSELPNLSERRQAAFIEAIEAIVQLLPRPKDWDPKKDPDATFTPPARRRAERDNDARRRRILRINFEILRRVFAKPVQGSGDSVTYPSLRDDEARAMFRLLQAEYGEDLRATGIEDAAQLKARAGVIVRWYGRAFLIACHGIRISWRKERAPLV